MGPSRPSPRPATDVATVLLTVLLIGGTLVALLVIGRPLWFASDEWNIMTEYPSGNLLVPFNGHLSAVPVLLYQVLFHTTGVVEHLPYRILGLACLGALATSVAVYSRARVGAAAALVLVAAVLWNSSGSTNLLFPFLLNFSLPIALLVAAWWLLDRNRSATDAAAGVALTVALACSGLGVVALGAVVVEFAVARAPWRRWLTVVAPGAVLWGLWWIGFGESGSTSTDLPRVAWYAARMLLGGATAVAAGWQPGGVALIVAFVGLVGVSLLRWHTEQWRDTARIAGSLAAPAAFVLLTASTRIDTVPAIPPDELRYGWTTGALLLLAAVACWRPTPQDRRACSRFALPAWVLAAVVVAVGATVLWSDLRRWVDEVSDNTPGVRMNLYAAESIGRSRIDPEIVMPLSFVPVTTGRYLAAVAELGSPIDGTPESRFGGRPDQLEAADRTLARSLTFAIEALPAAAPSPVAWSPCPDSLELPPGAAAEFERATGVSGSLVLRRFGPEPVAVLELPDGPVRLTLPSDAEVPVDFMVPYRVEVPAGTSCRTP